MPKYQIWDKQTDIITPGRDPKTGKQRWSAQEYMDTHAEWAKDPNVQVVIAAGAINGGCFMEYEATKAAYLKVGAEIEDGMTPGEVLAAIEDFEDNPPEAEPTPEERIAAALDYQNLLTMEDEV
jgi:hypothetical protein